MRFRSLASRLAGLVAAFLFLAQCSFSQSNGVSPYQTGSAQVPNPASEIHPQAPQIPENILSWDADMKTYAAKVEETEVTFQFNVTNISTSVVVIDSVSTSCGCTVAKLPSIPWIFQPGSNGQIQAVLTLTGKTGTFTKAVMLHSDKGEKTLLIRATVGEVPHRPIGVPIRFTGIRERNQQLAKIDRQSVFRGDCAKCHADPARGKKGEALYSAACGICHDADHRADSVPDLHHLAHETSNEFWLNWITRGKAETMMPAFASDHGGPLDRAQIESLVVFLETNFGNSKASPIEKKE